MLQDVARSYASTASQELDTLPSSVCLKFCVSFLFLQVKRRYSGAFDLARGRCCYRQLCENLSHDWFGHIASAADFLVLLFRASLPIDTSKHTARYSTCLLALLRTYWLIMGFSYIELGPVRQGAYDMGPGPLRQA